MDKQQTDFVLADGKLIYRSPFLYKLPFKVGQEVCFDNKLYHVVKQNTFDQNVHQVICKLAD